MKQMLIAGLLASALFGTALFALLVAEHRRRGMLQRLTSIVAQERSSSRTATSASMRSTRVASPRSLRPPRAVATWLEGELAAAGNRVSGLLLLLVGMVAAAGAFVLAVAALRVHMMLAIALAATAAAAAPLALLRLMQARHRARFLAYFPDALDIIVRAVKAGLPVLDAVGVAASEIPLPVGSEFQAILDQMRIGVEIDEAFQHTADRLRIPDFQFFVVALALQRRTGGALAEILMNLSAVIRRRKEMRARAHALSAEARATAVVLGILPIIVGGLLYLISPALMASFITDPRGRFMLGVAIVSLLSGVAIMVAMIKRSVR